MGVLVSVVMQGGNEGINYLSTGQTATGAEIRQKQGEYLSRTQDTLVDELVNYGMTESQAVELLSGAMGEVLAQSAPMGEVRAEENAPITSLEPTLAPEATQSPQISSPAPALTPEASSEPVQIKTPQSATQAATEAENIINTVLELKNSEASAPAENASAETFVNELSKNILEMQGVRSGNVSDLSWKERTSVSDNGDVFLKSKSGKKDYRIPSPKELNVTVRDDGAVSLTSNILEDVNSNDYRDFAKAYADNHLVTHFDKKTYAPTDYKPYVIKSDGNAVIITTTGINDFAKKLRGAGLKTSDNLSSLLVLDRLIENATKEKNTTNRHSASGNPFAYYNSVLNINGRDYLVKIYFNQTQTGDHYYYHALEKTEVEPLNVASGNNADLPPIVSENSSVNNSIPNSAEKINPTAESPASDGTGAIAEILPEDGNYETANNALYAVNPELLQTGNAVTKGWNKFYQNMVSGQAPIEKMGTDAAALVQLCRQAGGVVGTIAETGLVTPQGEYVAPSYVDVFVKAIPKDQRAAFNEYRQQLHNINRMSLSMNANYDLAVDAYNEFIANNPEYENYNEEYLQKLAKAGDGNPAKIYITLRDAVELAKEAEDKPVVGHEDGTPYTAEESSEYVAEVEALHPEWVEIKDAQNKWWDTFNREWLVKPGILSEAAYDEFRAKYPNYMPTYRVEGEKGGSGLFAGRISANVIKEAKGSVKEVLPLEQQFIEQINRVIQIERRNELGQYLYNYAVTNPTEAAKQGVAISTDADKTVKAALGEGYDRTLDAKVRKQEKYGIDWCVKAKALFRKKQVSRENCWFIGVTVPNTLMTKEQFVEYARDCGYPIQKQALALFALEKLKEQSGRTKAAQNCLPRKYRRAGNVDAPCPLS